MFSEILQKFADRSPATVMVRGLLEHLLHPEKLDRWFESTRQRQYTRSILFSSLVGLMLQVVCRTRANVHEAYRYANIAASIVAVYDKLKNLELSTSRALVRDMACDARTLIEELGGAHAPWRSGYRVKYLDGNCLAATEHRLKRLRTEAAAPLPGKSLVIFEPQFGLCIDVIPCADGHAQERALLDEVVSTIEPDDIWVADRNFCVLHFLASIHRKGAFFVMRQHANLPFKPLEPIRFIGHSETGDIFEQAARLCFADGEAVTIRRVTVKLKQPTRDGSTNVVIVTNVPPEVADAVQIAALYRQRWGIETAFQKLEKHLNSEINTLGYPKAALFGFCLALVAYNLYATVMAAMRAAHPTVDIDATISEYYLAGEIANTMGGLEIAVSDHEWSPFVDAGTGEMCEILRSLASGINLDVFRKTTRGPKKPPTPRIRRPRQSHVSTAKLLGVT